MIEGLERDTECAFTYGCKCDECCDKLPLFEIIEKLQGQNKRLRECMRLILEDIENCGFIAIVEVRIRTLLKDLGEE